MAIRILRESAGTRTPGYKVSTSAAGKIVGGTVVTLEDADTIMLYVAAATGAALGLAIDSNVLFSPQNASPDHTAGQGYNYLDYDRGGLISVINKGAEVEVYDDGRSVSPFSASAHTYLLNKLIYAEAATGMLADAIGTGEAVGRVTSVAGTYGVDLVVRFIVTI
jgi:hypothetical protein